MCHQCRDYTAIKFFIFDWFSSWWPSQHIFGFGSLKKAGLQLTQLELTPPKNVDCDGPPTWWNKALVLVQSQINHKGQITSNLARLYQNLNKTHQLASLPQTLLIVIILLLLLLFKNLPRPSIEQSKTLFCLSVRSNFRLADQWALVTEWRQMVTVSPLHCVSMGPHWLVSQPDHFAYVRVLLILLIEHISSSNVEGR